MGFNRQKDSKTHQASASPAENQPGTKSPKMSGNHKKSWTAGGFRRSSVYPHGPAEHNICCAQST
ncbi:MAG: hypothetical protein IT443_02655 [Phycisphaeraceae bacterium]|nr:hypothetical protein [Phycisphaeraceae bacterium]